MSIAIDSAFASNSEAIERVSIDESGKILACLSLYTCFKYRKIGNILTSLQLASLFNIKMSALTEEEGTTEECALGNDNHPTAIICCTINNTLQCCCLNKCTVSFHTIFRYDITLA